MRIRLSTFLILLPWTVWAQQPDTTQLPKGGKYSYIVGTHSKKGVFSGPVEYFDSTGTLRMKGVAERGKWEGLVSYFDSTGILQSTVAVRHGKWNGVARSYRRNGRIWTEGAWQKSKREGVQKMYHPNGALAVTSFYKAGRMFGETILWDSTGAVENGDVVITYPGGGTLEIYCMDGRPEGKLVSKRPDGSFMAIGTFRAGLPVGDFIYYDGRGTPVRKDTYDQGRFKKSVPLNQYP